MHASDNTAVIYLYRPNTLANMMVTPDVMIDDVKLMSIDNNQYHHVQLPPGRHQVRLVLPERYQGKNELLVETVAGQNYFVRISSAVRFQMNRPYDRWFDLELVSQSTALREIMSCKPYITAQQETIESPEMPTSDDAEYSSQKFRNPFSR